MAPKKDDKKKVEEPVQRTAQDEAVDRAYENVQGADAALTQMRESLLELQTNLAKAKHLEQELGPAETDHKNLMYSFRRLVEGSGGSTKVRRAIADGEVGASLLTQGEDPSQLTQMMPNLLAKEEESSDPLKQLAALTRETLYHMLLPYFLKGHTKLELSKMEAERQMQLMQQQQEAAAAQGIAPKPGGKGKDKQAPQDPTKQFEGQADIELLCPPGVDVVFFDEMMLLRNNRLAAEKHIADLHEQLATSKELVAKHRETGVSKTAVKRLERQLQVAQKTHRDLVRHRELERELKRRNDEQMEQQMQQQQQQGGAGAKAEDKKAGKKK